MSMTMLLQGNFRHAWVHTPGSGAFYTSLTLHYIHAYTHATNYIMLCTYTHTSLALHTSAHTSQIDGKI